jgi:RNAse (barnase) inhibitor barstar
MSATPLARLLSGGPSGVFLLQPDVPRARIAALCRLKGLREWEVDCSGARSKRRLMQAFARDLQLPDYFGANWDALFDCLTDLEWAPAPGHVLVLRGLEGLARRAPQDYAVLLDVLSEAAASWQEEDLPFYALLVGEASALGSGLPAISG